MEQNLILSVALEFQPFTVVKRRECKLLGKKGGSLGAGEWDGILHSCVMQAPESRGEKQHFEKVTEPER